jgi:hypothetical protein
MTENLGFLPASVTAGETIWVSAANTNQSSVDIIIPNYTPAAYTLAYQFAAATPISVAAVANSGNTGWTLTVTSAQTLLWKAGSINFAALATEIAGTARVFAVDAGFILVGNSPLAVSQYAAALAAVEAALVTYAGGRRSFTLGDLSVTYNSISELLALRDYFKGEVQKELAGRGKRILRTRFT